MLEGFLGNAVIVAVMGAATPIVVGLLGKLLVIILDKVSPAKFVIKTLKKTGGLISTAFDVLDKRIEKIRANSPELADVLDKELSEVVSYLIQLLTKNRDKFLKK